MVVTLPFTETWDGGVRTRVFSPDGDPDELVWHRDEEDRTVRVLEGTGWYFQRDDELPIPMKIGDEFKISRHQWHRVIMTRPSRLVVEVRTP